MFLIRDDLGEKMIKYDLTEEGKKFLDIMPKKYSSSLTPEFCDAVDEVVKKIQEEETWESTGYFFDLINSR